jgi:hypothetical protein
MTKKKKIDSFDQSYSFRYHDRNKEKTDIILRAIHPVHTILDIGCNKGYVIQACLENHKTELGFGIELDSRFINKDLLSHQNFTLFECDIASFNFNQTFDIIIYNAVHHHVFGKYGRKEAWRVWQDIVDHCESSIIFETGMVIESGEYYWKTEILKHFKNDDDHFQGLLRLIGPRLKDVVPLAALPIHGIERILYKIELFPKTKKLDLKSDPEKYYGDYYSKSSKFEVVSHCQRTLGRKNQKLVPVEKKNNDVRLFDETDFYVLLDKQKNKLFFAKAMPQNPYKQMREFWLLSHCNHTNVIKLVAVHKEYGLIFPYLEGWRHLDEINFRKIKNRDKVLFEIISFFLSAESMEIDLGILDFEPDNKNHTRKLINIIDLHMHNFLIYQEKNIVKEWCLIDLEYFGNNNRARNLSHLRNIVRTFCYENRINRKINDLKAVFQK